ncbi:endolytic transglycosylase MltG [Ruminococcus sp. HUN007]|uniref:endolytic transglycosylase MltG n=1 Tax=Ruminococcus sp. HUN007 TaxID=1514668 RepID=UPI0005D156AB|nr:endolytic transglycosylase MltG [Ruminococcus sp. HUN007]
MEGYLFPDTYEFYKAPDGDVKVLEEQDYEIILRTIYENFEAKYDDEMKKRAAEVGMTMDKVVTLASIVQLEAANTADMKNVASVFMKPS